MREAFSMGREKDYVSLLYGYWQTDELSRLCAEALAAGIEVDYAKEAIRTHRLAPSGGRPEDLRRLALARDDQDPWRFPVDGGRRSSRLIRGKDPPAPQGPHLPRRGRGATGDDRGRTMAGIRLHLARISFKTTLSRLRKIIGEEVDRSKGREDRRRGRLAVWLDVRTIESLAERVAELSRYGLRPWKRSRSSAASCATPTRATFCRSTMSPGSQPARERLRGKVRKDRRQARDDALRGGSGRRGRAALRQPWTRECPPGPLGAKKRRAATPLFLPAIEGCHS